MVSDNMVALIINLNNVATVHAEDLTLYSYCVQQKSTLLGLLCFMKNSALPEHHVTAQAWLQLNYAKNYVDFSIGELGRSHSPSLVKYPVYIKYLYYSQLFSAKICLLFFFCNLASLTVFLGELYILPSHKMPAYPTSAFLISTVLFMWFHLANQQ